MEDNEEISLEDVLEEHIGKCIACMEDMEPGSPEHIATAKIVRDLYEIAIKYTEVGMKYEDNEKQRQHEAKMKEIDTTIKVCELELAKLEEAKKAEEQRKGLLLNGILMIADGIVRVGVPTAIGGGLTFLTLAAEYKDNKYFNTAAYRSASGLLNKSIKPGQK